MDRNCGVQARYRPGAAGLAFAGVLCIAVAAWAQTIRIPDFRQRSSPVVLAPGEKCNACGRIVSIREIEIERKPVVPASVRGAGVGSMSGAQEGNLVGAVIYLPLGGDTSDKPYVGAVGTPEMRERFRDTTYEIGVRLDDGTTRLLRRTDGTRYAVGDRVRLSENAGLELISE
ncbi:MAG TPA: hypothetical protein VMK05_06150 [Burkholderiales bacterium]|nr:hypothetical protein [Burkholderiales bacterium]